MEPVKGGSLSNLLKDIPIPKMFRAEQSFKKDRIEPEQIPGVVREQLSRPEISSRIQPGMNIAITAGSRGIANVNVITRAIVDFVKKRGHIRLSFRPWEAMEVQRQRARKSFLPVTELQKRQWDARLDLPWKRCSWDILSMENRFIRIKMRMRPTESLFPAGSSPIMLSVVPMRAVSAR